MTLDEDLAQHPADTEWHRLQKVGDVPDGSWVTRGPANAYASVTMRPLEPFLVPEKPRGGELDPNDCHSCRPSEHTIWHDEHWQVRGGWETGGLPFIGAISPREHWLLEDAPVEMLAGLGPLMQRISQAVKTIPSVARCHFSRWNDGSAHLHLWAFARPAGMMQGRGAVLSYWDGMLTEMPETMMRDYIEIVAEALAEQGGQAFPTP
ncbi:hypothetical protein [Microbacterium abyssi]|uniref:hypothetical protein n=1 Tax=Microbacterium abyssi TaxID=2782166 RepID=UPI00188933C4|nr:hypothetical protein [Microbacterium sp. A18JL241]